MAPPTGRSSSSPSCDSSIQDIRSVGESEGLATLDLMQPLSGSRSRSLSALLPVLAPRPRHPASARLTAEGTQLFAK